MTDVYGRYAEALRQGHQRAAEGRFKDALSHYQEAAQAAGDIRALPHVCVGGMFLRLGKPKEALEAYDRALASEPGDLDALTGRAAALLAAGRRGEAQQVQQEMARIRDGGASAPAGLDWALNGADRLMAAGDAARAGGRPNEAIDAWLAESAEHRSGAHYDAALDACLRALALDSAATRTHVELARVWSTRGWQDMAAARVRLLERLLELKPDAQLATGLRDLAASTTPANEVSPAR